jgi:hypothetical protein
MVLRLAMAAADAPPKCVGTQLSDVDGGYFRLLADWTKETVAGHYGNAQWIVR